MHIPKVVDHVRVRGEAGTFLVLRVDHLNACAHVVPLRGYGNRARVVPFEFLEPEEAERLEAHARA